MNTLRSEIHDVIVAAERESVIKEALYCIETLLTINNLSRSGEIIQQRVDEQRLSSIMAPSLLRTHTCESLPPRSIAM
jgi:hypothetical protein